MWYLDCFSYAACLGTEFPVNSYSDKDPKKLAKVAAELLERSLSSGVDEIRLSRTTQGESPLPLKDELPYEALHDDVQAIDAFV